MAQKAISFTQLSDTLSIGEFNDGFWLYDETRGMNLAMRAKSRDEAFTEALTYYQKRLKKLEEKHGDLVRKVNSFIGQFSEEEDDGF